MFVAPCPRPRNVKGRNVHGNDFSHGKSITFSRDRNLVMTGRRRRIWCNDGRWSDDLPTCKGNIYI